MEVDAGARRLHLLPKAPYVYSKQEADGLCLDSLPDKLLPGRTIDAGSRLELASAMVQLQSTKYLSSFKLLSTTYLT